MEQAKRIANKCLNIMRGDSGINGYAQGIEQIAWVLFLKAYDLKGRKDKGFALPEKLQWDAWAGNEDLKNDELLNYVNTVLFPGLRELKGSSREEKRIRVVFQEINQHMKEGERFEEVVNLLNTVELGRSFFGDIYEEILNKLNAAGDSGEFYTPPVVTDFIAKVISPRLGEKVGDLAAGTGGMLTSVLNELSPQVKSRKDQELLNKTICGVEKKAFPYLMCVTNLMFHGIDFPRIRLGNSLKGDVTQYKDEDKFDVLVMNPPYGGKETDSVKENYPKEMQSNETANLFMAGIMYRLKEGGRAAVVLPNGFLFGRTKAEKAIKKQLLEHFNLHTIVRLPAGVFSPYTSIETNILFFEKKGKTKSIRYYRVPLLPEGKAYSPSNPFTEKVLEPVQRKMTNEEVPLKKDVKVVNVTAELIKKNNYDLDHCDYQQEEESLLTPAEIMEELKADMERQNKVFNKLVDEMNDILSVKILEEEGHDERIDS